MKWYVLHVLTGSEPEVQRKLEERGFSAMSPAENRMIRSRGVWQLREYRLFPGYVFALLNYGPVTHHILHSIPGVIRLLPRDKPIPLTSREMEWIHRLGRCKLTPSKVDFCGREPVILDGPLRQLQHNVDKIDRHRRRAQVTLTLLGEPKQIELSIQPVENSFKSQ